MRGKVDAVSRLMTEVKPDQQPDRTAGPQRGHRGRPPARRDAQLRRGCRRSAQTGPTHREIQRPDRHPAGGDPHRHQRRGQRRGCLRVHRRQQAEASQASVTAMGREMQDQPLLPPSSPGRINEVSAAIHRLVHAGRALSMQFEDIVSQLLGKRAPAHRVHERVRPRLFNCIGRGRTRRPRPHPATQTPSCRNCCMPHTAPPRKSVSDSVRQTGRRGAVDCSDRSGAVPVQKNNTHRRGPWRANGTRY